MNPIPPAASPPTTTACAVSGSACRMVRRNRCPSAFAYGCGNRSRRLSHIFLLFAYRTSGSRSDARHDRISHDFSFRLTIGPAASYHVLFAGRRPCGKTSEREWGEIRSGVAADDEVCEYPAGGRRMLEAMAAETVDQKQSLHFRYGADDRVCVRRHLVEAGPRVRDGCVGERGQAFHGDFGHLVQKIPAHRCIERRRL